MDITWKLIDQFKFCEMIRIVHNLRSQTIWKDKRLGNSIVVKSNIKLSVEYTNNNLSREFVEHALNFFNHVKELKISHKCVKRQIKAWGRFFATMIWNLRL